MASKNTLLVLPEKEPMLIIRQSFVDICEGDHRRAAILSIFHYWTEKKPGPLEERWIWKSTPEISREIHGIAQEVTIRRAVRWLKERGFLSTRHNPRNRRDRTLHYRFEVAAVQAAIDALPGHGQATGTGSPEDQDGTGSGWSGEPCRDQTIDLSIPNGSDVGTIPEITSQTTPEITSSSHGPSEGRGRTLSRDSGTKNTESFLSVTERGALSGEPTRIDGGIGRLGGMDTKAAPPPPTAELASSSRRDELRRVHEQLSSIRMAHETPEAKAAEDEAADWLLERGHTPEDHESLYRYVRGRWSNATKRAGNGKPSPIWLRHVKKSYADWKALRTDHGRKTSASLSAEELFQRSRRKHRYDPAYWEKVFHPNPSPFSEEYLMESCYLGEDPGKEPVVAGSTSPRIRRFASESFVPWDWEPTARFTGPEFPVKEFDPNRPGQGDPAAAAAD